MKNKTEIHSIDGIQDFGHYYVCIRNLIKPLNCSNHYIEMKTGLDHHTVKKLILGTHMRSEHKVIEKICYCFQCNPDDFSFYIPPKDN